MERLAVVTLSPPIAPQRVSLFFCAIVAARLLNGYVPAGRLV